MQGFYVATKCFMSQQSLVKERSSYVATEYFCVAIEFGQGQKFLCSNRVFLCCDRVWPWAGIFTLRQSVFMSRQSWSRLRVFMSGKSWPR